MDQDELHVSEKWLNTMGIANSARVHTSSDFIELIDDSDHPIFEDSLTHHLQNKSENISVPFRLRTSESLVQWVSIEAVALRNETGEPYRVIGWLQDITKLKFQEELLDLQKSQLIQSSKLSALGEMAGGNSHEINNPLAVVRGFTEKLEMTLSERGISDERISSYLQKVLVNVDRISRIIKGLRSLSRDASSDPIQLVETHEIIEDALGVCETKLKNQGVEVHWKPEESLSIRCRRGEALQILVNLISNAVDAVEELEER